MTSCCAVRRPARGPGHRLWAPVRTHGAAPPACHFGKKGGAGRNQHPPVWRMSSTSQAETSKAGRDAMFVSATPKPSPRAARGTGSLSENIRNRRRVPPRSRGATTRTRRSRPPRSAFSCGTRSTGRRQPKGCRTRRCRRSAGTGLGDGPSGTVPPTLNSSTRDAEPRAPAQPVDVLHQGRRRLRHHKIRAGLRLPRHQRAQFLAGRVDLLAVPVDPVERGVRLCGAGARGGFA